MKKCLNLDFCHSFEGWQSTMFSGDAWANITMHVWDLSSLFGIQHIHQLENSLEKMNLNVQEAGKMWNTYLRTKHHLVSVCTTHGFQLLWICCSAAASLCSFPISIRGWMDSPASHPTPTHTRCVKKLSSICRWGTSIGRIVLIKEGTTLKLYLFLINDHCCYTF